jgi:hypothetical protein
MAATELDFALASFGEFARIWKAGKNCKLVLTCNHGQSEVKLVAGLVAADEYHERKAVQASRGAELVEKAGDGAGNDQTDVSIKAE